MVREQTVKAVLTIINKLNDRIVNGELLKFLARTANDEQPGIRTNTTICLGRIAKNLGQSVRVPLSVLRCMAHMSIDSLQGSYRSIHKISQGSFCPRSSCRTTGFIRDNRCVHRG